MSTGETTKVFDGVTNCNLQLRWKCSYHTIKESRRHFDHFGRTITGERSENPMNIYKILVVTGNLKLDENEKIGFITIEI